jgi:membrane protein implicated in regulation of membrane protease activity
MSVWIIWFVIAIVCIILEIFTPGFFLLSFGIGALLSGLISFGISNLILQVIVFIITSFLVFLWLRKYSKKMFSSDTDKTNVYGLIGKSGIVTTKITENNRGYVKIGGEEWPAIPFSTEIKSIDEGTKVIIKALEGNKVLVDLTEQED